MPGGKSLKFDHELEAIECCEKASSLEWSMQQVLDRNWKKPVEDSFCGYNDGRITSDAPIISTNTDGEASVYIEDFSNTLLWSTAASCELNIGDGTGLNNISLSPAAQRFMLRIEGIYSERTEEELRISCENKQAVRTVGQTSTLQQPSQELTD